MADGHYPVPDDITTGDGPRLLDEALSPAVRAACLVEGEGVVDPEAFARALGDAPAASGVKIHENAEVTGFRTAGGRVTALRTDGGEMPCSAATATASTGAASSPSPWRAGTTWAAGSTTRTTWSA
ncbi:FAD-dependent oxidoreductase [Streptomyces collinus]|uniref:FAD-dependent oxidoreductase n=1 Tax=Streptomyces collinus TaxID=42684 RepID=UPI0036B6380B